MAILSRLCRFVDWDLSKTGGVRAGAWSLLIAMLPPLAVGAVNSAYDVGVASLAGVASISAIWLVFVGWRGWRLFRATAIKADRKFDQETRFKLPPEYRKSESLTEAKRRERARRR
jgi:hypothetical protein